MAKNSSYCQRNSSDMFKGSGPNDDLDHVKQGQKRSSESRDGSSLDASKKSTKEKKHVSIMIESISQFNQPKIHLTINSYIPMHPSKYVLARQCDSIGDGSLNANPSIHSINQSIKSINPFNQSIKPINPFNQPINQSNPSIHSINQSIKPINPFNQPINQSNPSIHSINQSIKPINPFNQPINQSSPSIIQFVNQSINQAHQSIGPSIASDTLEHQCPGETKDARLERRP